ncbi:MAG: hypothetical protein R3F56_16385 [Planctomycetota bacterium]
MTRHDIVWIGEVLFGMYLLVTGLGTAALTLIGSPLPGLCLLLVPLVGFCMLTMRPLTALAFSGKEFAARRGSDRATAAR